MTVQLIGVGPLKDTEIKGSGALRKAMTLHVADGAMVCCFSL